MKVKGLLMLSTVIVLTGCVSKPSNIEGVQREQERYINDMQSHKEDPVIHNTDGIDIE